MALPTREELLSHVEFRFYELAPDAPVKLDPNNPSHQTMIRQWHQAHHEVLSKLTDTAFFGYYPDAPKRLDPADPEHATYIEYWNDIAEQIDGRPGKYDWSHGSIVATIPAVEHPRLCRRLRSRAGRDRHPRPGRLVAVRGAGRKGAVADGSLRRGRRRHPVGGQADRPHLEAGRRVARPRSRRDPFATYSHWWRSAAYSEVLYDEDDRGEELAFVRDLTLEAKIDRNTGVLHTPLRLGEGLQEARRLLRPRQHGQRA